MAESQTIIGVNAGGNIHAHDINVVQNIIKPADSPPKNVRFKVEKTIQTFTGRETFLEELHKVVKEGQVTVLTQEPLSVVAATGGIGKTETVRRYIQLHEHEYDHIIWIDAEDNSFAQRQFLQLATELKISTDFEGKQKEFESILKEIFGKLLVNAYVVLLVFDNAEAMDDDEELSLSGIRSLRPTSLSPFFVEPTIIVTSRNQNWRHQKVIQLDLWTEAEVVLFVTEQLKLGKTSKITTLALQLGNLFGRLPIALQSAVAVILQQTKRGKKYGIQSLIDEYESGSRKVLTQKPSDANKPKKMGDTMLVLWNISLKKIVRYEDGELAIKILCFMAYMSQTRIPKDFLFALCKNSCTEDSFENALEILADYSLIASLNSNDSDSCSFSIHRMIQDSTIENLRTRATNEGQTPHAIFNDTTFSNETEVLLKLSAESVNYLKTFTELTFLRSGELVENLIQITNHVSEKLDVEEFRDLTEEAANVLQMTNNFQKSIELFERVFQAKLSGGDIEIANKISLQHSLAVAYLKGGHVQKSLDLYLNHLKVLALVLGPDHDYTLDTKLKVAIALDDLGRVKEATKMFQEVLHAYENSGKTQGTAYLQAKAICASVLFDEEDSEVSFELLTEVLREMKKDSDFNSNIVKKSIIVFKLTHEGKLEEASKLLLQRIKDATELYGPLDLRTLNSRFAYAVGLQEQNKYDLAVPLLLDLIETEETQLGADHRSTLQTKFLLAEAYLATKELDKAEALLDVEVMERVLGPEHPETLNAATVLSRVKEEQGELKDALALSQKVLEVRKKVVLPNHEVTLSTMYDTGVLHYKMEEYKKAAEVAQELLELQEKAIGKDHPSAIKTLEFLTSCMERLVSRNNLIMTFMAGTSVDAETGKLLLKASNWNFEAALVTYCTSNPSRILTDAEIENNLIRIFIALTKVNAEAGKVFLQTSDWKLKSALEAFFESSSVEDNTDLDLHDDAMILSAAATNAENQHVDTIPCITVEVNQTQDVEVQVDSVAESNQPTTSILFCLAGGTRFWGQFGVSSTVKDLYNFVNEMHPHLADSNYVLTLYPNIQLTKIKQTLEKAKIIKKVALTLKMLKK